MEQTACADSDLNMLRVDRFYTMTVQYAGSSAHIPAPHLHGMAFGSLLQFDVQEKDQEQQSLLKVLFFLVFLFVSPAFLKGQRVNHENNRPGIVWLCTCLTDGTEVPTESTGCPNHSNTLTTIGWISNYRSAVRRLG